jgi:hypothetical protein
MCKIRKIVYGRIGTRWTPSISTTVLFVKRLNHGTLMTSFDTLP